MSSERNPSPGRVTPARRTLLVFADSLSYYGPQGGLPADDPRIWPNIVASQLDWDLELIGRIGWTCRDVWWAATQDPRAWAALPKAGAVIFATSGMDSLPSPLPTAMRELIRYVRAAVVAPVGARRLRLGAAPALADSALGAAPGADRRVPRNDPRRNRLQSARNTDRRLAAVGSHRRDLRQGASRPARHSHRDHRLGGPARVPLVDLKEAVAEQILGGRGNPDGIHWNFEAHEAVAELMLKALAEAGVPHEKPTPDHGGRRCDRFLGTAARRAARQWGIHVVPLHVLVDGEDLRDGIDDGAAGPLSARHVSTAGATPAELRPPTGRRLRTAAGDGVVAVHISTAPVEHARRGRVRGRWVRRMRCGWSTRRPRRWVPASSHWPPPAPRSPVLGWMTLPPRQNRRSTGSTASSSCTAWTICAAAGASGRPPRGWEPRWRSSRCCASTSGAAGAAARVRTSSKAVAAMVEQVLAVVGEQRAALAVHHIANPDAAADVAATLSAALPGCGAIVITDLGPVLGVHVGPGALGVVAAIDG